MKRSSTINYGSLQKLVDGLIDDLRSRGYTEGTLCNYRNRLRPIRHFLAKDDKESYTPDVGLRYYADYLSNHSPCMEHQRAIKAAISRLNDYYNHSGSVQTTQIYAELSQNIVNKHLREWNEKWFPHDIASAPGKEESNGNIPAFLTP